MSTEEQLKSLGEKLAALEAQLQDQAGASAPSTVSPSQITVKVPKERKLRKFAGSRDDHVIEEWILDAERATTGQSEAEAVDFLIYHLEGAAREEVRLRPAEERNNPAAVFKILRGTFGEGLTSTQALRRFFERRQKERETIQDFTHALMLLLSRVERLSSEGVADKDKLLRDQFLENLRDPQLRRDIKRWARDNPTKTFQHIREEVQRWVDGDNTPPKRVAASRETTAEEPTCEAVKGSVNLQSVVNELVAGQKLLAENLQKQQKLLADHIRSQQSALDKQKQTIAQLMPYSQQWSPWQPGCFGCGSTSHFQRDCPASNGRNQRGGGGKTNNRQNFQPPALNEKTPRQ